MLFKNTLAQSSTLVASYAFSLLLAPLLLSRLGLEQFGVWAVTGALALYAGLIDFGISRAVSRHIALYDAEGDHEAIAQAYTLGLLVTLAVTAITGVAALLVAPLVSDSLGVLDVEEMRIVLLCSAAILSLQTLKRVMNAVGVGLRQMVAPNVANVSANAVNFSFSVGVLLATTDLVPYAIANVVADTIGLGISYVALRHVWKGRLLRWPSGERAREMFAYGMKSQVHFISLVVNLQTDKVIVAFAVDARAAGAFELATRVVTAVKGVGYLSVSALVPTATAEIAARGREVIAPMYRRYTRLASSVAFPIFIVTCLTAPALLVAWLGDVPSETLWIVLALNLAWFVNVANETGMNLAAADGRPGAMAANTAVMAVLHIVLALALAPVFGVWGIVAGAALSIVLASGLFVQRFHSHYGIPVADFVRAAGPPALLAVAVAVPLSFVYVATGVRPDDRLEALLILAPLGLAYTLAYWLLASHLRLLPGRLTLRLARPRSEAPTSA